MLRGAFLTSSSLCSGKELLEIKDLNLFVAIRFRSFHLYPPYKNNFNGLLFAAIWGMGMAKTRKNLRTYFLHNIPRFFQKS